MELAREIPLAGHMGREKMKRRFLQRFYWPTLYRDVEQYYRGCLQCQDSSNKGVPRAPLIPLPIVEEAFQRIAMDIVRPLPKSRSGNRFVLVICKRVDAEHTAKELAFCQIWGSTGDPNGPRE